MDYYINRIIQSLINDYSYTEQKALEIFEYYRPVFKLINDRYWNPDDWAEILHNNYQDNVKVEDWTKHVEWCKTIPARGSE